MNLYRLEDVAENNGQNGAKVWVVIQNSVYDLTDYIEKHPGGDELILEFAGKDGTKGFNDFGHSSDAKSYMKKYKIGELEEIDCKENKINGINKESKKSKKSEHKNRRYEEIHIIILGHLFAEKQYPDYDYEKIAKQLSARLAIMAIRN